MRLPKIREIKEALTAVAKGPYTHPFPKEPTPIPENLRGAPKYNPDYCIGCGACAEVCPADAISVKEIKQDGKTIRRLTCNYANCIFCGECQLNCTTEKGIQLSNEYELSYFDEAEAKESIDHEMLVCEICGKSIAPKKQYEYLYQKLGTIAYANPTVYLSHAQDLELIKNIPPRDDRPIGRWDMVKICCPSCRRDVLLKEEWG